MRPVNSLEVAMQQKQHLADSYAIEAAKLANKGMYFNLRVYHPANFSTRYTGHVIAIVEPCGGINAGKIFEGNYMAGDCFIDLYRLREWERRNNRSKSTTAAKQQAAA